MKLPRDSQIAREKVTDYLLKLQTEDDKSKFLSLAGYTSVHADKLLEDLHGIRGTRTGPNGRRLRVVSFWMTEEATGQIQVPHFAARQR